MLSPFFQSNKPKLFYGNDEAFLYITKVVKRVELIQVANSFKRKYYFNYDSN